MNKAKLATALTTAAIIAGLLLPASSFASTVKVKDNGAGSKNHVTIVNTSKSSVKQTNKTAVINFVGVSQNTGGNEASKNTGGDVTVGSGNATSNVTNNTTTGGNTATNPCPCGTPADDTVTVSGNGADSHNSVDIVSSSCSTVTQTNKTLVVNGVLVDQNTGGNDANKNTGGSVDVSSGDASSTVTNNTTTGGNTLNPTP